MLSVSLKVLIVDDDKNICELLRLYLEKDGYETAVALNGRTALEQFEAFAPDCILLDVMLPYYSGTQVCQTIRETADTPIIMITARSETDDVVDGLNAGADDYITKPFEPKEVLARIKAVTRRFQKDEAGQSDRALRFDRLLVDIDRYELTVDDHTVNLPAKEMELLYYLASNPNRVFTRDQLLDAVWGFDYIGDSRTVDVHIKRLREKIEGVSDQWGLRTVWRVGYKFEVVTAHA